MSMSQRTTPPFRADHVGSLLRPAALKDVRAKFAKGEIDAAALKGVEDREIERVVRKQEEIGLKLATDGEFRRSWWHFDFFGFLDGVARHEALRRPGAEAADAPALDDHVDDGVQAAGRVDGPDLTDHQRSAHARRVPSISRTLDRVRTGPTRPPSRARSTGRTARWRASRARCRAGRPSGG